jgi:hypothetical protein
MLMRSACLILSIWQVIIKLPISLETYFTDVRNLLPLWVTGFLSNILAMGANSPVVTPQQGYVNPDEVECIEV